MTFAGNIAMLMCKFLGEICNHNCKHARVSFGAQTSKRQELFVNTYIVGFLNKFTFNFVINIEKYGKVRPATCQTIANSFENLQINIAILLKKKMRFGSNSIATKHKTAFEIIYEPLFFQCCLNEMLQETKPMTLKKTRNILSS